MNISIISIVTIIIIFIFCILSYSHVKQYSKNKKILNRAEFKIMTDLLDNIDIHINKIHIHFRKELFEQMMAQKKVQNEETQQVWEHLKQNILKLNLWNDDVLREIFACLFKYSQNKDFKFNLEDIAKFIISKSPNNKKSVYKNNKPPY